jgi:hypothetical protein
VTSVTATATYARVADMRFDDQADDSTK